MYNKKQSVSRFKCGLGIISKVGQPADKTSKARIAAFSNASVQAIRNKDTVLAYNSIVDR